MSRSSVALAVAAGLAGLLIGRAMPSDGPSGRPAHAPPLAMPVDCKTERALLVSTQAQLALCVAYRAPSAEPAATQAVTEPPSPADPPPKSLAAHFAAMEPEIRKERERLDSYPEAVLVRLADGTRAIYRPDEHSPDSDDVYARKSADGSITYYLGPDAGPRTDPNAWGSLRDLAGTDGIMIGKTRLVFLKPDAGAH